MNTINIQKHGNIISYPMSSSSHKAASACERLKHYYSGRIYQNNYHGEMTQIVFMGYSDYFPADINPCGSTVAVFRVKVKKAL